MKFGRKRRHYRLQGTTRTPRGHVGVLGAVALSCMTGFALGIYRFRGNLLIFFMFIAGNFVPFQILMVPVRDLTLDMGLYNTKTALVLFHIAFQTGFCTLFMRNFIKALPFDLIESARIEGVAEWKIFWYVVLPLVRPAIAALAIVLYRQGIDGTRRFLARLLLWRASIYWYVFLIVGVPLVFYASALSKEGASETLFPFASVPAYLLALFLMAIKGPVEEIGWRGVALPLLQRSMAPIWAGLVLGRQL